MSVAYAFLVEPFLEFSFMRRALVGCLALALGCGPVGTLLILRRMSLMGDALSHAVLPGAAIGFLVAGLSLVSMSIGGAIAGLAVALLSGLVTRVTALREDASFAAFYLASLALGVLIVSTYGSSIDLLNVLFGSILSGRWFSGARHADVGRIDDGAGGGGALLGSRGVDLEPDQRNPRARLRLCRAAALLLRQSAIRPGDHPDRRRLPSRLAARGNARQRADPLFRPISHPRLNRREA